MASSSSSSADNVPATFIYQISTNSIHPTDDSPSTSPIKYEITRPVPPFLCDPSNLTRNSELWHKAFIDVVAIVNAETHETIMSLIRSSPHQSGESSTADPPTNAALSCSEPSCTRPATDCLKSPNSLLHIHPPTMIVTCHPHCGTPACETSIRTLAISQMEKAQAEETVRAKTRYGKMTCAVCGVKGAGRCNGCGLVAYCGKKCQAKDWTDGGHRKVCKKKKLDAVSEEKSGEEEVGDPEDLPYEEI